MNNENIDIKKSLEYIGFSEKEVLIYLALLSLGKGTVTQISKKAGINRPTAYHILASLESKNLVKVSGKEPKQEYVSESPDQIEKLIDKKIKADEARIKEARKIIPELKSIHNVLNRPRVLFYEGKEGLERVYENTLTSTEEIRAYASVEDVNITLPNYFPQYYKRRAKKNISIRAIFPDSGDARELIKHDKDELRKTVLVPKDRFIFHPEINIYDDKVMIASWREKLGVIIESQEIADAMKKIYELAWVGAETESKKLQINI
jgi:sugar-specific transcriptional regulator TrmB